MSTSRPERLALAGLVLFFTAVYVVYGLFRHWSFHTSYDLAIFDQAVWHLARFERPASSIKGMASLFGDHFHPIIALFVPAYWVAPRAEALIVAQSVLLAAAIVPIFLFLRRRLSTGPSLALAAAYGFFWGVQHTAAFDVHEYAFAPLIIACAVVTMDRRQWPAFWTSIAALLLVKEDLIPLAVFFGVVLFLKGERRRGILLMAGATAAFFVAVAWLIPWINGAPSSYAGQYTHLLEAPWRIAAALVTPPEKAMAVVLWLAPFLFLPLASPLAVLLVPLALIRLLPAEAAYWSISFHHAAPLAPILAMGAGDGLARLAARVRSQTTRRRVVGRAAGVSVLFSAILPGAQPFWDLFEPEHYARHPHRQTWDQLAAEIPPDASVVAQSPLLPHVSGRRRAYLLEERALDGGVAEFVVATAHLGAWPAPDDETRQRWIDARRQAGYRTIVDRDGWVLLQRQRE